MIVGNGDLASVVKDRENILYFFSGVSNSQETDENQYQRELDLLLSQDNSQHIVYCSSLSIFYSNGRYARHKRTVEETIKRFFKHYTILRIGNITWGNNPYTLINYFKNKIKNKEAYEVQDTYRYILDKEEFLHWLDMIPSWNCEMNIPGKMMKVSDIIKEYGNT